MKIQIKGWSSRGLRCPDFDIDLTQNGNPTKIALVQMPNGTGKTTTLEMLTATLNGEAKGWTKEKIRKMSRTGDTTTTGEFKIDLLADSTPITFVLKLDFHEGTVKYTTTSPDIGGLKLGWYPPRKVEQFLSPEFLRLFVFDGEFAGRLLNPEKSEAEKSIDALCQLYLLDNVKDIANSYWEKESEKGPKTKKGLTMYKSKLDDVNKQLIKMEKCKKDAELKLKQLEKTIEDLDNKIERRMKDNSEVKEQFENAKRRESEITKKMEEAREDFLRQIRQPQYLHEFFGAGLVGLKNSLDILKLPDITSSTFFEELANESICVCGRTIGSEERQVIVQNAGNYLDTEETATINSIKRDITRYVDDTNTRAQVDQLSIQLNGLSKYVNELALVQGEIGRLTTKLAEQGDEELKQWEIERQSSKESVSKNKELLDEINGMGNDALDISNQKSLSMLRKLQNSHQKSVGEISGTLSLRRKTQIIMDICDSAMDTAREQIRKLVLEKCNKMLSQILSSDPLKLNQIEKCLVLEGQHGGSVGQELSVGYAFLLTVLQHGNNDFPLIVDSPAGSLDETRRKEIGKFIPEHCSQFITFLISTERAYFVNAMERAAESSATPIHYITAFRKTAGVQHLIDDLPVEIAQQTENSVIIPGRDYFTEFALEKEV